MQRPWPNYATLSGRLRLLVPDASVPQPNNLALFIYGLVLCGEGCNGAHHNINSLE